MRAVLRFVYDFIVGDDWKIAVGVVVALTAGLLLLLAGVPAAGVAVATALLAGAAFAVALLVDVGRG